jgi:uncharacterized membrane protein
MDSCVVAFLLLLAAGGLIQLFLRLRTQAARLDWLQERLAALERQAAIQVAARLPLPTVAPAAEAAPTRVPDRATTGTPPDGAPEIEAGPIGPPPPPPPFAPAAPIPLTTPAPPAVPPDPTSGRTAPQPTRITLEERLGARLPVWIGSIALALAGAFLVKYSFDQGWLSPRVRVAIGVAFGVGLVALGEQLQRRWPRIAQALPAAGIADLFACFLAATSLYHLISPLLGFALMALTAVAGVLLALRHGAMVALIGLLGGFLTPAFISTGDPNPRRLFAYLAILLVSALGVAWKRGESWLIGAALLGGFAWVQLWIVEPFHAGDGPWLSLFLFLCAGAAVSWDLQAPARPKPGDGAAAVAPRRILSAAALAGALLLLLQVGYREQFSSVEWGFLALLGAGILVLAHLRPQFEQLIWAPYAATLALLIAWGVQVEASDRTRFWVTALVLSALYAVGGWVAQRKAEQPGQWAALSSASGVTFFSVAWLFASQERDLRWSAAAAGLAALYLLAAYASGEEVRRRSPIPMTAWMIAAATLAAFAVPLALEREGWTIGWALEALALVAAPPRIRSRTTDNLGLAVGAGVLLRLLFNPFVLDYPISEHSVYNWLVYGYGLPLAAFALAAGLARRRDEKTLATAFESGAIALGFALATLEVRQWFHPGALGKGGFSAMEVTALVLAWLLVGLGLSLAAGAPAFLGRPSLDVGGKAVLAFAGLVELIGVVVILNPVLSHEAVGDLPILNRLLLSYGAPALLLALAGTTFSRRRDAFAAAVAWSGALFLAFVLVTLEVRQAFHGSYLDAGGATTAERYAYSAAWLVFGILLLVAGVARKGRALRFASLGVTLLTVLKVFLYDASGLTGLYRVASFFGLGVSLLGLAWAYQRFVFREEGVLAEESHDA